MQTILGKINGTFLVNLLTQSYPVSKSIRAAVAYAELHEPLIDHLRRHPEVRLKFYGRMDETGAVAVQLLDWFLKKAPPTVECFLVNGAYHPKVIWWHGYGAYIGSANLTRNGWEKNIEAGLFLTEDELEDCGVAEQLDNLFEELDRISLRLTNELYAKLDDIEKERRRIRLHIDSLKRKYDDILGKEKPYAGQTFVFRPSERPSKARQEFVDEWRETLQLMRTLCRDFDTMKKRPVWVPATANPTVHFDQFLHGYYYHIVLKSFDEGDSGAKVGWLYERHKASPERALATAADWWASLSEPPSKGAYDKAYFIRERAPRMQELLTRATLESMTEETFVEAMINVYAFRDHARRIENSTYGLPADHHESEDERVERFAKWIWTRHSDTGKSVVDLLRFVIYASDPVDAVDRLWIATRDKRWRLPRLGKSSLGEVLGWARPNDYPPRNDRTNKALRALGYDVQVFK
ncbi:MULTISPECIES: phospholipase D family protein [Sorangium]|uniref:Phospholipase n=1 Tax=Sorangium cellulosum TaxID=56 RepID=A0A3S7UW92_SORCE|nr:MULTISPECIES: phospholipase D family protein [Sorangium]AUX30526.1 phospholipase [Sorangium cellulosum]AYM53007.1 phospholipase [Sorangium cellulosum]WCQ89921.1 hypothetical protein NQZ70_02619 [Sorangium sp. Soce836]